MIALGDSTDFGRRTITYLTVLSLCSLAGPPISGAIYHATGGYSVVGIYAGRFSLFFLLSGFSEPCMSHARLRIYDDGLCGTPRPVSLHCTKEMERKSLEESSRRLRGLCRLLYSHRFSMHRVRTRMLPMYSTAHVYDYEAVSFPCNSVQT
jgi:hypothetical protein